jgi:hypothetical protein
MTAHKSGESYVVATEPSPALSRACHEIIDAASALMLNVDYLADGDEEGRRGAVRDARTSVERIVKIAKALRSPPPRRAPTPEPPKVAHDAPGTRVP